MHKLIVIILLTILLYGCNSKLEGPYKVINIVDGDTLDLEDSRRLRLSGINTPETGECYYREAKDRLTSLVLEKSIFLEKDKTNTDKYGRTLRYIYINDSMINSILVQEGCARVFDKYKEDTKRYEELKIIEETAKINKLGLWGCEEKKNECLYVGSKNSKTYHKPDCKFAKKIKPENLICYTTESEVKDLTPCNTCF